MDGTVSARARPDLTLCPFGAEEPRAGERRRGVLGIDWKGGDGVRMEIALDIDIVYS